MNHKTIIYIILPLLFVLLTFISVNAWSEMPIGNYFTTRSIWLIFFFYLVIVAHNEINENKSDYLIVYVYLAWAVIGIIRGCYVAENYWEWRNLYDSGMTVLLPFCVLSFKNPIVIQRLMHTWLILGLIAYISFFYWQINVLQFYLGPIYFVLCFLPIIPSKFWKFLILFIGIILLSYNIEDERSQFIKAAVAFVIALCCYFKRFIPVVLLKISLFFLFIIPIVLLYLGLSGTYNIFEETWNKYEGIYVSETIKDGEYKEFDMSDDTRSIIYNEVLLSAINNNYIAIGRTPARGNDTERFIDYVFEQTYLKQVDNIKFERIKNEVCFPNIFTWLGLIGMVLYILIYLVACYKGLYCSNNFYVKLCAMVTAFNFLYGWVENATAFDTLNFVYWFFISICLSKKFRNMSDLEFKTWFGKIFT
jgi:hypothetical protein